MSVRKKRRVHIISAVVAIVLLVVLFLPWYGAPFFRYTGSDPERFVWNIGWPLAHFIYDPLHGLQVFPFWWVEAAIEVFVVSILFVVTLLLFGRR